MAVIASQCVIQEARGFVARGWCQNAEARDRRGNAVEPWDEGAVAWSLLGSIVAVLERESKDGGDVPLEELAASLYALADVIDVDSLALWNDTAGRTQHDALAALDAARLRYEPPWPDEAAFSPN